MSWRARPKKIGPPDDGEGKLMEEDNVAKGSSNRQTASRGRGRGSGDRNHNTTRGGIIQNRDVSLFCGGGRGQGHGASGDSGNWRNGDQNAPRGRGDHWRSGGGGGAGAGAGHGRSGGRSGRGSKNCPSAVCTQNEPTASNFNKREGFPVFGFRRVEALLSQQALNCVLAIEKDMGAWQSFIKSDAFSPTNRRDSDDLFLCMVMQLLAQKVCSEGLLMPLVQNDILRATASSLGFIGQVNKKINAFMIASTFNTKQRPAFKSGAGDETKPKVPIDTDAKGFIKNTFNFCSLVFKRAPETARDFLMDTVAFMDNCVKVLSLKIKDPSLTELEKELEELVKEMRAEIEKQELAELAKEALKRKKKGQFTEEELAALDTLEAPSDYRQMSVVPTMEELRSTETVFLLPNKERGAYQSAEKYLDTQFRLMKEDFIQPLRRGVQMFLQHPQEYLSGRKKLPLGSIRLYNKVKILRSELVFETTHYWLQLPQWMNRGIKWERSKRFLPGSLVVLTNDLFKTGVFGLVGIRDEKRGLKDGQLTFVPEGCRPTFLPNEEYLLVESDGYFEAYRHILKTLQTLQLGTFPMAKFIVEASAHVGPPAYLNPTEENDDVSKITIPIPPRDKEEILSKVAKPQLHKEEAEKALETALAQVGAQVDLKEAPEEDKLVEIDPLFERNWPSAEKLQLDEKQYVAFKAALTQEFSIIQGPPGTGKTYLGLRIAEVLLRNWNVWMTSRGVEGWIGPLVVVCYTNHALDQFLEGILDIKTQLKGMLDEDMKDISIVRLGGRSKSDKLEECMMKNQRRNPRWRNYLQGGFGERRHNAKMEVEHLAAEMGRIEQLMNELGNPREGIVDFQALSVWEQLMLDFPPALWHCLRSSETFFRITDQLLSTPDLNSSAICNEWFGKNVNSKLQKAAPPQAAKPPVVLNSVAQVNESESDNDEDYDMNELMEHRLIEEHQPPRSYKNYHSQTTFVGNLSYLECIGKAKSCEAEIEKLQTRRLEFLEQRQYQEARDAQNEINQRSYEKTLHDNRRNLLSEIFRRCRNKEIQDSEIADKLELLQNCVNVQDCVTLLPSMKSRWAAYFLVASRAIELLLLEKVATEAELIGAERRLNELRKFEESQILRHSQVVGMTTTGASKYQDLLQNMNSKILIVEEAAEVQESHIVTCITRTCQHVILIGDHFQLKPNPTVYELAMKYHMNVSLFERMINNNLHCYTLSVQHRMRPEISDLVRGTVYKELLDAPSTQGRPDVWGVSKNLFFLSHTELETAEKDTLSKSNDFEAEFLLGLCRYLLRQGYAPEQITVLCTYTGQMFLLKKKFRHYSCAGVRITCVDNFQGEENDIILLSLVRSNEDGAVGFLKVANRVCVALSRAKNGLYVVGNMEILSQGSEIWPKIKEKFAAREEIGACLPIFCRNHGTVSKIFNSSEFDKYAPEGGCTVVCDSALPKCPHKCFRVCHLDDKDHSAHKCMEQCTKTCGEEEAHPCRQRCFNTPCEPCEYQVTIQLRCNHPLIVPCHKRRWEFTCCKLVDKDLDCGHIAKNKFCHIDADMITCYEIKKKMPSCNKHLTEMACYVDEKEYECKVKEIKTLPCGHKKELECFQDVEEVKCRQQVEKTLPCGHTQMAECFMKEEDVKCNSPIKKELACEHEVDIKCKDKNSSVQCKSKCTTRLDCGHACRLWCSHEDPDHKEYQCKKECSRKCPSGHDYRKKHPCFEKCPPCQLLEERKLPKCGHMAKLECHVDPQTYKRCREPCERVLDCGDKCDNKCGEDCGPCLVLKKKPIPACGHDVTVPCNKTPTREECVTLVKPKNVSACGHATLVPCNVADKLSAEEIQKMCNTPCGYIFPKNDDNIMDGCEHKCKGTCGNCRNGSFHLKCNEACERTLVCGHICDFPCAKKCPPCKKQCALKCEHSRCKKLCGQPCTECKEKCGWKCSHKKCTKLCGEICDREPCDEPCPRTRKCGHACIGFCGEPCPPLCRECDKEKLLEFQLLYTEDEPDSRFVWLPDCGHCIEVEGLTMHLNAKNTAAHEIDGVKKCPRCQTVIRSCRRFNNLLRTLMVDVHAVREKVFGDRKAIQTTQKALLSNLSAPGWKKFLPKIQKALLDHISEVSVWKPRHYHKNKWGTISAPTQENGRTLKSLGSDVLNGLQAISKMGEAALAKIFPKDKHVRATDVGKLHSLCEDLFTELMNREHPLSQFEIRDGEREVMRLIHYKELLRYAQFQGPKQVTLYAQVHKDLMAYLPYTTIALKKFKNDVQMLENECKTGLGISPLERLEIVRALGMGQGHWFKCPNGHAYAIGDCGGPAMVSKCNECGAAIGGSNHTLLRDNNLASEMDGATTPAWPPTLQR